MPWYRITYEKYLEYCSDSEEEAVETYLEVLGDTAVEDLTIEVFDEEAKEWKQL